MDDAGVYRLSDELALVQSVDFFTPVVDDPYTFGQIAAANALSDLYAMGAQPITALNLAGFPSDELDLEILAQILRGGGEKVAESGAVLVGGHTVTDVEPKYGLAVTGIVHPDRILTNSGARPGDCIVLTKPLGIGVITTLLRKTQVPDGIYQAAVAAMTALNRAAAEAAQECRVHACTDVTGFGLLGHLNEMALASGLSAEVEASSTPLISGVQELVTEQAICGGSRANREHLKPWVVLDNVDESLAWLLFDTITSGGLLASVPEERLDGLLEALKRRGVEGAACIGRFVPGPAGKITVRG